MPVSRRTCSAYGWRVARRVGAPERRDDRGSRRPTRPPRAPAPSPLRRGRRGGRRTPRRAGGDDQDEHDQHLQHQDLAGDQAPAARRSTQRHARSRDTRRRGVNSTNTTVTRSATGSLDERTAPRRHRVRPRTGGTMTSHRPPQRRRRSPQAGPHALPLHRRDRRRGPRHRRRARSLPTSPCELKPLGTGFVA